jgi:hypothetical protein
MESAMAETGIHRAGAGPLATSFLVVLVAVSPPIAGAQQSAGPSAPCATERAAKEIRSVGTAMLSWVIDVASLEGRNPRGTQSICPGASPVDVALVPAINHQDLTDLLVPLYIPSVPQFDPWGHAYEYRLNVDEPLSAEVIAIRSPGSDGSFEGDQYDFRFTTGPDEDLVLYNVSAVREPPRLDPVSRQLLTMGQVAATGHALLTWYTDVVSLGPTVARSPLPESGGDPTVDLSLMAPRSHAEISALLYPLYSRCVPERDGWGGLYEFRINDDLLGTPLMSIRSAGSGGQMEGIVYTTEQFPPDDHTRDIVWSDGQFYREPGPGRQWIFLDGFETGALWGTWSCGPDF